MNKRIFPQVFQSNEIENKSVECNVGSLYLLIMFNVYQELMFKELSNLKHDVCKSTQNFEILILEFQNICDDIF